MSAPRNGPVRRAPFRGAAAALLAVGTGCAFDASRLDALVPCRSDLDCPPGRSCVQGYCVPGSRRPGGEADGAGADGSGVGNRDAGIPDARPEEAGPSGVLVAAIKAPRRVFVSDEVEATGEAMGGEAIAFHWRVSDPEGEEVPLDGNGTDTARTVRFRPLSAGEWRLELRVSGSGGRSSEAVAVLLEVVGFRVSAVREGRDGDLATEVRDLSVGPGGDLWLATDLGMLRTPTDRLEFLRYGGLTPSGNVPRVTRVAVGRRYAWFAESSGRGYLVRVPVEAASGDAGAAPRYLASPVGPIRDLTRDGEGNVLLAAEEGLARAEDATSVVRRLPFPGNDRYVRAVAVQIEGIWIARRSGLCLLTPEGECLVSLGVVPDPPGREVDDLVTSLVVDREGFLWVGTDGQGLYRRRGLAFDVLPPGGPEGLPPGAIYRVAADPGGDVWVAGEAGLFRVDAAGRHAWRLGTRAGLPQGPATSLAVREAPRAVFVGTSAGLARVP